MKFHHTIIEYRHSIIQYHHNIMIYHNNMKTLTAFQRIYLLRCLNIVLSAEYFYNKNGFYKYAMIAYTFLPQEEEGVFVCLFDWSFSSNSGIVHSYGDVNITSESLQILIHTTHYSIYKLQQEAHRP